MHRDRSTALAISRTCASEMPASDTAADENAVGVIRTVLADRISSLFTLTFAFVSSPSLVAIRS